MRRSLIPSLLGARRVNEAQQNEDVALFEIAKIYLPQSSGLPEEPWMLGLVSELGFVGGQGSPASRPSELSKTVELRTADAEIPAVMATAASCWWATACWVIWAN